ncbi:hypothetical protein Q7P37_008111 [Cladosporium fusiforme]
MCNTKRTFADFSTPLSPFKPTAELIASPGSLEYSESTSSDAGEFFSSTNPSEVSDDQNSEPYIGSLIAAGSDVGEILARICTLTNEIHPIFRDENICACEYKDIGCCLFPYYATHRPEDLGFDKAPRIDSPYPKDNPIARAILQLATNIITSKDALPFWAGIIECGLSQDPSNIFRVHPRKHLSPEREKETLQHLREFSHHIRIHFRALEQDLMGFQSTYYVEDDDPDYDDKLLCHPDGNCTPQCPVASYGQVNGKRAIVNYPFQHIFLNTSRVFGFDRQDWDWVTVTEVKESIAHAAITLSHELSHALTKLYNGNRPDPLMNDEPTAETGFSLEAHLFGGALHYETTKITKIVQWPNIATWEDYNTSGSSMRTTAFGKLPWPRTWLVDAERISRLTEQRFWDDGSTHGLYKKLWLRPYHETPRQLDEYMQFSSGHEPPVEASNKQK